MHPLEKEINNTIHQEQLISDDERVIIVGVSGGPDSVALLHLLLSLKSERGIEMVAAYINHGLRQSESEYEEQFVRSMCRDMGIEFESIPINVKDYARQEKKSLEHAARDLRYQALRNLKQKHGASLIAVAHTADDQAEEILIRLLRGSGRKGISGMRFRLKDIVRPLLSVGKKELLAYLEERNIPYCTDSSNTDMRFLRNRVRHELIPYLEENFDKGIRNALCKTADSLAEDEKILEGMTQKALNEVLISSGCDEKGVEQKAKLDRKKFVAQPVAVQRRAIEQLLWQMDCKASYAGITRIVEAARFGMSGSEIHLSRGLRVGVQREFLEFVYPKGKSSWRGRLYE
jgi:tRNA(Ile)-lysidine synthase